MWSSRARLAAAFAGMLVATLAAFSTAVYFARRAAAYQELGQRAVNAADNVLLALSSMQGAGAPVVRDSLGNVIPQRALRNALEPRPGYFLVLDGQSRLLYSSFAVRQLSLADQADL